MRVICTICSEEIEDLYATLCGHIFHRRCIVQWISRSKTCPQCRKGVTEQSLIRIYQPAALSDKTLDDAQAALDSLKVRLDGAVKHLQQQAQARNELKDQLEESNHRLQKTMDILNANKQKQAKTVTEMKNLKEQLYRAHKQCNQMRRDNFALKKTTDEAREKASLLAEKLIQTESRLRTSECDQRVFEGKMHASEGKLRAVEAKLHVSETKLRASEVNLRDSEVKRRTTEYKLRTAAMKLRVCAVKLRAYEVKLSRQARPPAPHLSMCHPATVCADEPPRDRTVAAAYESPSNIQAASAATNRPDTPRPHPVERLLFDGAPCASTSRPDTKP